MADMTDDQDNSPGYDEDEDEDDTKPKKGLAEVLRGAGRAYDTLTSPFRKAGQSISDLADQQAGSPLVSTDIGRNPKASSYADADDEDVVPKSTNKYTGDDEEDTTPASDTSDTSDTYGTGTSYPARPADQTTSPVTPSSPDPTTQKLNEIDRRLTSTRGSTGKYDPEIKSAISDLNKLRDQFPSSAPDSSKQTLQDAIDKANELYQQKSDRNDWLEVAQTLGRAATQYAAARAGQHNRMDLTGIDMGKPIDYEARTERALKERGLSVGEAEKQAELSRQEAQDKNAAAKENFLQNYDVAKTRLDAALRGAAGEQRADLLEQKNELLQERNRLAQGKLDDALEAARIKAAATAQGRGGSGRQLKDAQDDVSGLTSSIMLAANTDDKAVKDNALKQVIQYSAKTGLPGMQYYNQYVTDSKNPPTKPGTGILGSDYFGQKDTTQADTKLAQTALAAYKAKTGSILRGLQTVPNTPPASPTQSTSDMSVSQDQLRAYAQKYYPGDPSGMEKARKFLESQGHTIQQ